MLGYSLPSRIISSILADGGKQKYRNDCAHCPPFEKRYLGKSSREQKNKNSGCCSNYLRVSSTLSWNISVATMSGVWLTVAAEISSKQGTRIEPPIMDGKNSAWIRKPRRNRPLDSNRPDSQQDSQSTVSSRKKVICAVSVLYTKEFNKYQMFPSRSGEN